MCTFWISSMERFSSIFLWTILTNSHPISLCVLRLPIGFGNRPNVTYKCTKKPVPPETDVLICITKNRSSWRGERSLCKGKQWQWQFLNKSIQIAQVFVMEINFMQMRVGGGGVLKVLLRHYSSPENSLIPLYNSIFTVVFLDAQCEYLIFNYHQQLHLRGRHYSILLES